MPQSKANQDRAALAETALDAFIAAGNTSAEDFETNMSDLLTNLFHLCDYRDIPISRCLTRANNHYETEAEENKSTPESDLLTALQSIADLESGNSTPSEKLRAIRTLASEAISKRRG